MIRSIIRVDGSLIQVGTPLDPLYRIFLHIFMVLILGNSTGFMMYFDLRMNECRGKRLFWTVCPYPNNGIVVRGIFWIGKAIGATIRTSEAISIICNKGDFGTVIGIAKLPVNVRTRIWLFVDLG